MKAQGKLNEYADLYKKLHEAVYKAKANNPNAADQTPYVQGRAGDGANPGQFAKFDPATSTTANATQGIGAMAAGGQAARDAAKPAPANPANELELFKKLVAQAAQAQSEVATGQASAGGAAGAGTPADAGADVAQGDPLALKGQVAQVEKQGGVDPAVLAKAGKIIQDTFKKGSPTVKKTGDAAVDALLLNMGFQL
jgi:hypothetical protein